MLNGKSLRLSVLSLLLAILFSQPLSVLAQAPTVPADCTSSTGPTTFTRSIECASWVAGIAGLPSTAAHTPGSLLQSVINWLLSLVAVLALLALIVGGVMYILSFGSEDLAKRAKRIIMYAIIGLLVVFLSFAILSAVQALFVPTPSAAPAAP